MTANTQCITPEFRVSYPKVFKPERNELNGNDEYSIVALFKKDEDLSKLKAIVKAAAEAQWGADPKKWPKDMRSPFKDQGDKEKEDDDGNTYLPDGYVKGATFCTFKSQKRPGLVNGRNEDIIDESDFYGGCYARAQVNAKAYDKKGNKGVSIYLNHVQKTRDGDSFGSSPRSASDVFEAVDDAGSGGSLFD